MARDSLRWQVCSALHRVLEDAFASPDPDSGCPALPVRLAPAEPLDADRLAWAVDLWPGGHAARPGESTAHDALTMAVSLELLAPAPRDFERLAARAGNLMDEALRGALAGLAADLRERDLAEPETAAGQRALRHATLTFEIDLWIRPGDRFAAAP